MLGLFIYDHIRSDRRIERLENKLMSRDYRDYEAVKVEKKAAEKLIDVGETEVRTESEDFEKFNAQMEEDWDETELDMEKVKAQLKKEE